MKVILQQDVARLGKKYTEVEVSDGYALNKLIPGGMAVPATKANRERVAKFTAQAVNSQQASEERLKAVLPELEKDVLTITAAANEHGGLFQAVDATMIVTAAAARDLTIDQEMVQLPDTAVKQVGEYTITLKAGGETANITLLVVAANT